MTSLNFTGQTQHVVQGSTGIYDFLFRQQASNQGRWLAPDPAGLAAVDITNPQTWNRYAYVGNNPLSNVDPLGLCDGVIGGVTQTSTANETEAQTTFANSIGAELSYPYPNPNPFTGIPQGAAQVVAQGFTFNDSTKAAYATIMSAAAQTPAGQNFNIFTFSGGAQAFNTALGLVPSDVRSRIGNVVYISPGNVTGLASGNTSTTVITDPLGPLDNLVGLGSVGNATLLWTNCGHNANCAFQQFSNFLKSKAGTACPKPITVSRGHGGGGGGSGSGGIGIWFQYLFSGSIEVVTHKISLVE